jgi:diguanylate cyclase (GGDEF)-like protein/PAS domain S-box-containing protein
VPILAAMANHRLRYANWPIAVKLIALSVGCAVLLAGGLTSLAYTKASASLTGLADAGLRSDALLTAQAIDHWNSQRVNSLAIEARQPALMRVLRAGGGAGSDANARDAQRVLSALAGGSPDADSIGLLSLSGAFVLSSNPVDLGSNVSQRDYFLEAAGGRAFISGVSISTITHAPAIFHSVPVTDQNGTVLGVLRSRSSLDAVTHAVSAASGRVGVGAAGVVLDQQGLVIASSDPSWTLHPVVPLGAGALDTLLSDKRWGGAPAPDALGQPDLAAALGTVAPTVFEWTHAEQVDHSIAIPLTETHWTYVLGVPVTSFSAGVNDFLRDALLAALAGVLLITILVSFTARQIADSVSMVAAAARKIATEDLPSLARVATALAEGDLTREAHITARRLEVRGRDELGAMAHDFNAMIGGLQATGAAFKHTSANLGRLVAQVETSAARFEALVQNAADVILIQSADWVITYASPATLAAWGRAPELVVGRRALEEFTHPDDRAAAAAFIADALARTGSSVTAELRMVHVDGSWREMEFTAINLLDRPSVAGLVLTCRDVSQHKTLERQLRLESDRMLALHRASAALADQTVDPDTVLNEVLRNALLLVGGSSGSLHRWDAEAGVLRAVCNRDVSERHATPDIRPGEGLVGQTFNKGGLLIVNDYQAWEYARRTAVSGHLCAGLGVPLLRGGKCLGVLTLRVYGEDPTRFTEDDGRIASLFAREAAEALFSADAFEQQRRAALYDPLTGLPNRTLLRDQLDASIEAVSQGRSRSFALMVLDLDRFKEVNDTLGHHVGDVLLQQLGGRLLAAVRAGDLVARLGGDEFAVLVPDTDAAGAEQVARDLVLALQAPFLLEGHPIAVDASIGIAFSPQHGLDADTLLRCADVAMYQAKRSGAGIALYNASEDVHRPDRLALLGELRSAIDNGELLLHYQPKVDMRDGSLVGVEALVRWQHPQRGFLPPMEFIPLAEQTGLIYPLSHWVLEAALKQHQVWRSLGIDVPVAVNLSRRTLHDPQLPGTVAELLTRWDVAPGSLVLEITETSLMSDPLGAGENLTRLRALGVRVSIDDFGTGYSSLASLKNLPVDELKIDQSFVQAMSTDASCRAIVRAIIDLADALNLQVVAEGVEDRATWDVLAGLGCQVAQGYFVGRPVAASGLLALMPTRRPTISGQSAA